MNTSEYLYAWAQDLLTRIHSIDPEVVGGIGGMGSEDGHYTSELQADRMGTMFDADDEYTIEENTSIGGAYFCIYKTAEGTKGFTMYYNDPDEEDGVQLCFFDDTRTDGPYNE